MSEQTQLLIKIDPELKKKVAKLARQEGKTTSLVVREMVEAYVREHDIASYVDDLWGRIGAKMRTKGRRPEDVRKAIRSVRAGRP